MKEFTLPPAGSTQLTAELVIVSFRLDPVLINPFVSNKLPATSIAPASLILRPALLFISKLLKAFEPVKSPSAPPIVCNPEPEKETVAPAPEPPLNAPELYRSIVPLIKSFLL